MARSVSYFIVSISAVFIMLTGCTDKGGGHKHHKSAADSTAPTVSFTAPARNATNIAVNRSVSVTFSEEMDTDTVTDDTGSLTDADGNVVSGTISHNGATYVFDPDDYLEYNSTYTVTLSTDMKDLAGNALAEEYSFDFTTGTDFDSSALMISSTDPADGAEDVAINRAVSVVFSKVPDASSVTASTFTLTDADGGSIPGSIACVGNTVTFTPGSDLARGTAYAATLTTGINDLGGNALSEEYTFRFTTGSNADTTAPAVSSAYPTDGMTNTAIDTAVSVIFDEPVDIASVTASTFTLSDADGNRIPGSVTCIGNAATFIPASDLENHIVYTAALTTGIKDLAGNALAEEYTFSFTTGSNSDTTPPDIYGAVPATASTDVAINTSIAVFFTEAMDAATISTATVTLEDAGGLAVYGTVAYRDKTAYFTPAADLEAYTRYTITVSADVKDLAGNAMSTAGSSYFTTGSAADTTAPTVTRAYPADGSTNVRTTQYVSIHFSEPMDLSTLTSDRLTLRSAEGDAVSGSMTFIGASDYTAVLFYPDSRLNYETAYTFTVSSGAKDLAGNAMASDYTFSFTTGANSDTVLPVVSGTVPADGAIDIVTNTALSVTFSEAMDASTITASTFLLKDATNTAVSGSVSYADLIATFSPDTDLSADTAYTVTVTTGAQDESGNAMAGDYTFGFTTGAGADTTAPTVASVFPDDGATDIAYNAPITIIFSEPIDTSTLSTATMYVEDAEGHSVYNRIASYSSTGVTLDPSLNPRTAYTLTVTTGVKDLAGNSPAEDFTSSFTTGGGSDYSSPTVRSVTPAGGSTGVALNSAVAVAFSERMNPQTITTDTVILLDENGNTVAGSVSGNDALASFVPSGNLAANTTYTLSVNSGVKDAAGRAMYGEHNTSFTTGSATDTTPPTVTSAYPADGDANLSVFSIEITFSEAINPATVDSTSIILEDSGGNAASGTFSYSGTTLILDPVGLESDTSYTVTVTTALCDLAGNPLAGSYSFSFATGDTAAPNVVAVSPVNNVENVPTNSKIAVLFDEAVDTSTVTTSTIRVQVDRIWTVISGTWAVDGALAVFTPDRDLAADTRYRVNISGTQKDLAGNEMTTGSQAYYFTTGNSPDTAAPAVAGFSPADGSVDVAVGVSPSVIFGETMDATSITQESVTLEDSGGSAVSGSLAFNGTAAVFTPDADLNADTAYTLRVSTGVKDLAGNAPASASSTTFTTGSGTDAILPTVTSTSPADGDTNIAIDGSLSVTFSEAMDLSSISSASFYLEDSDGNALSGTFSYSGTTVTFTPTVTLASHTLHTLTATTALKDLSGNALAGDYTFSFTSGADTIPPTITLRSVTEGETDIPVYTPSYSVTFSEPMDASSLTSSTIYLSDGAPLEGSVEYDSTTFTATFSVDSAALPLGDRSAYTLTVTTGVTDVDGNAPALADTADFTSGIRRVIPQTGQTESNTTYDDGYYQKGAARSFSLSGDTVIDNATGLMWQDDAAVTGNDANWSDAVSYCEDLSLDGYTDWRLPDMWELFTLADLGRDPAIDPAFRNMAGGTYDYYWSSTASPTYTSQAWYIKKDGNNYYTYKSNSYNIRCVRGEAVAASFLRDDDSDLVTDTSSGLQWQDDADELYSYKNFSDAIAYCEDLALGGYDDWRLPNLNELRSIYDLSVSGYLPVEFERRFGTYIWSSTLYQPDTDDAWNIYQNGGAGRLESISSSRHNFRCVRGGE